MNDAEYDAVVGLIRGQHFRSAGAILLGIFVGVLITVLAVTWAYNVRISALETRIEYIKSAREVKVE